MIKFFRQIRRRLLSDNKVSKYLIYAIGEITLVVIGILIAIQINNWNSKKNANIQMINLLKNMNEDIRSDTLAIGERIQFLQKIISDKEAMLSLSDYEDIPMDRLYSYISSRTVNYRVNATTFDKIKNLGLDQNSYDIELSKLIDNYYVSWNADMKDFIDWDLKTASLANNYWYFNQEEFELSLELFGINKPHIKMLQDSISNKEKLVGLISTPKGRNSVKMDYVTKKLLLEHFEKTKIKAIELIRKIEEVTK